MLWAKSVTFGMSRNGIGKLVEIQHGPATVTGDESRNVATDFNVGKAATSRMIRKSGYLKYTRHMSMPSREGPDNV